MEIYGKRFPDEDFLLTTKTAQFLYHEIAEDLPIIDYHCHLNPQEIYEDRHFENIAQLWLGADHYKWRLMRAAGVGESYITGNASDREKFQKWAETLALAIGNPLYHWSHLELKRYFGYDGILNGETAQEVWDLTAKKLAEPSFSARNLIRASRVETLCTTDDPADDLSWHKKIAESGFEVKVLPAFRPDRALMIEKPDWAEYVTQLCGAYGSGQDAAAPGHFGQEAEGGALSDGTDGISYAALCGVLRSRMDYFHSLGCRVSDHGMNTVPFAPAPDGELERIFKKRMQGETISAEEETSFRCGLLVFLGKEYHKRGWVMQLHLGVIRDNSKRILRQAGADAGIDSIGRSVDPADLAAFLNALDETDELPKTVLYSLEPGDNTAIETVMACFQGGCPGKMQHGSAWWFNDHKSGMREQMTSLANEGLLSMFIGMLTDSRSFISYARHEYFRRVLCGLLGEWVEGGEYPADEAALRMIVEGICCGNARRYLFGSESGDVSADSLH